MDFKNWYNNKAKSYENIDKQGLLRYKIAIKSTPIKKNMVVVDIGCKTLSLLSLLENSKIKCNYYGIDISKIAVDKFASKINSNPQLIIKDVMEGIPLKDNFADRIFCLEVIEHVRTPMFLLEEISRVLKINGTAVISCPNPYYWINFINTIFKIKENEGHISSFRWQEIETLCEYSKLAIIQSKTTFMTFPPVKSKFYLYLRSICLLTSESIQYTVTKSE